MRRGLTRMPVSLHVARERICAYCAPHAHVPGPAPLGLGRREHPFMKTYVTIHQCKKEGRLVEAMELEDELLLRIESCDAMPPTGSMDSSTSNSGPKVT